MDVKVGSSVSKDGKGFEYLYVEFAINGNLTKVRVNCDYSMRPILINAIKAETVKK